MQHLKSPLFTYDPNIDLQDNSQALADFLSQKKGFCQQFASLMAVMLRSIGIPARIGLGFTQGDPVANETGTYIVHGHDYHSWVEVPFEGYGWLTFDPTPGFDDPSSLSYAKFTSAVQQCSPAQGHNCSGSKGDGTRTNRPGPIHVGDVKAGITNGIQGGSQTHTAAGARWDHPVEPRHDRGGARASCSRSGSRSCIGSGGAGACTPPTIPAG